LRLVLQGAAQQQLQFDTLALAGLMALAIAVTVTRFRPTLD
jgi:ABC-2 type transport system permease protein